MKFHAASLVLSILCLGCSTTQQLASLEDANKKVGGRSASILLRSGTVYDAERIEITEDSTRFSNSDDGSVTVIPTRAIHSFRLTQRVGGALEGLLFGSLGGISIGLFAGGREGGMAGIYGAMIAGVGGGIVGALKGHNYTFIVPMDSIGGRIGVGGQGETPLR